MKLAEKIKKLFSKDINIYKENIPIITNIKEKN